MFFSHSLFAVLPIGNEESPRIYLPRLRGSCAHRIAVLLGCA